MCRLRTCPWTDVDQTASGGGISSHCPWGDDNLLLTVVVLRATVNTVDLWLFESVYCTGCTSSMLGCVLISQEMNSKLISESETDTPLFIHTCISDPILYAHWTIACGRLLLTMY